MYAEGMRDVDELTRRLRGYRFGPLHRKVLDAMTNNETWFFRDLYPFEALKGAILPELLRKREMERSLSVWSAACSSGQEIYSVAMLIREHFPSVLNWRLSLLGTDISEAILSRARAGIYSQLEVNRGLPAILLAKYFQQVGRDWQLSSRIRDMAGFRSINLSLPWPAPGMFDVVFLRNVLIYFPLEVRREILARVRHVLRPAGCLFLGSAETTLNLDDTYERVPFQKSFYYRPKN
jgi:chemotaxis protein methyltransferase CheR